MDGLDGNAGWQAHVLFQGSFGYTDGISMTPFTAVQTICAGSPAAVRTLALRFARRGRELLRAGARELVSTEALLS